MATLAVQRSHVLLAVLIVLKLRTAAHVSVYLYPICSKLQYRMATLGKPRQWFGAVAAPKAPVAVFGERIMASS